MALPETIYTIGEKAFKKCSKLTSIELPQIQAIAAETFSGCSALSSVTISEEVDLYEIGDQAFYGCKALKSIQLPDCVTSIGEMAFSTSGLQSFNIPANLCEMGKGAFASCSSLTDVTASDTDPWMGDSGLVIDEEAFLSCKNLVSVQLSVATSYIGERAFKDCQKLSNPISIPKRVDTIGDEAFSGCYNLQGVVFSDPDESYLWVIGAKAFYNCKKLTSLLLPDSVDAIGDEAFWDCWRLEEVHLSDYLRSIGAEAFYGCAFQEIILPQNLGSIGTGAFQECSSLASVIVLAEWPPEMPEEDDLVFAGTDSNLRIGVLAELLEYYQEYHGWCNYVDKLYALDE